MTPERLRVPSLSRPGTWHTLTRVDGRVLCDCERFAFGARDGKTCRHVGLHDAAVKLLARCAERHGLSEPPRLCVACLLELLVAAARKSERDRRAARAAEREAIRGRRQRRAETARRKRTAARGAGGA